MNLSHLLDLVAAHRKAILTGLGLLLVQWFDSETVDWIVVAVDTVLVGLVPNDERAKRRIYRKRR